MIDIVQFNQLFDECQPDETNETHRIYKVAKKTLILVIYFPRSSFEQPKWRVLYPSANGYKISNNLSIYACRFKPDLTNVIPNREALSNFTHYLLDQYLTTVQCDEIENIFTSPELVLARTPFTLPIYEDENGKHIDFSRMGLINGLVNSHGIEYIKEYNA